MKEQYQTLIIRADASTLAGTGHLMRCLALSQAWQERGGRVIFVTFCESNTLYQRLLDEGFQVIRLTKPYPDPDDWMQTSQVLTENANAWMVLDGYHFDSLYQCRIKQENHPLMVIDDAAHLDHYYADIILNQNLHSDDLHYSCEQYSRLLKGVDFVLLRRDFWRWREWKRKTSGLARRVLVTMGGSDPENVTLKVIQGIQMLNIDNLEVRVVVGGSNPHYSVLQTAIESQRFPIRVEHNVSDMASLMAWADVAISAGGSTVWELAYMGLPSLVIAIAENQKATMERLAAMGAIINLGWHQDVSVATISQFLGQLLCDPKTRGKIAQRGQQLVDGFGAERVVSEMMGRLALHVRRASPNDIHILFSWANDPLTRKMSFRSKAIDWLEHERWFERVLTSPDTFLVIGELRQNNNDIPIGQMRVDGNGVVSLSIAPQYRGRRLSSTLLRMGLNLYFRSFSPRSLIAYIKPENQASLRAFTRVGFRLDESSEVEGQPALKYVYYPSVIADHST